MQEKIRKIKENIAGVMVGMEQVTELMLAAFLAGGHVLLEDLPGTGKTVLARSLAGSLGCSFGRIQFTPDLLPSDVTGINYFNQKQGEFVFREGPVFSNILLADEINRATPRTQSALLESMAERQVTVDGQTRILEEPFFVIATENPVESYGCFPLPEAQLDRFLMKLSMGALTPEQERAMLDRMISGDPLEALKSVVTKEEAVALRKACREIFVHEDLRDYIVALCQKTRRMSGGQIETQGGAKIREGVSPRGTLSLLRASQGLAMVKGRAYVVPEDVKTVALPVLAHRYIGGVEDAALEEANILGILSSVPVPTENWSRP